MDVYDLGLLSASIIMIRFVTAALRWFLSWVFTLYNAGLRIRVFLFTKFGSRALEQTDIFKILLYE